MTVTVGELSEVLADVANDFGVDDCEVYIDTFECLRISKPSGGFIMIEIRYGEKITVSESNG